MKKFLSLAFILAFTQSVGASDSFDMDPETQRLNEIDAMVQKVRTQCNEIEAINQKQRLISQVRAQCGNATEFDQYHSIPMRSVPLPILQKLVEGGWFVNALDDGPGLRNKAKGNQTSWSPVEIRYEQEHGGYLYHHFRDRLSSPSSHALHLDRHDDGNDSPQIESSEPLELNLSGMGLAFIPPQLATLSQLTSLNLACNCVSVLPGDTLKGLTSLRMLHLGANSICALPREIGYLTQLRELFLRENHFVDLPETFIDLVNLENLYIDPSQVAANLPLLLALKNKQRALGKTPVTVYSGHLMTTVFLENLNLVNVTLSRDPTDSLICFPFADKWDGQKTAGYWKNVISDPIAEDS